jgi:hypothetical protein
MRLFTLVRQDDKIAKIGVVSTLNIFSQIGKAVDDVVNATGDAVKDIDFNKIGTEVTNSVRGTVKKNDPVAVGAAATGGVAGAGLSATIGGMGLAVGGTAVGIGMAPVIAAGVVVGLGAYGVSKAVKPDSEN